MWRAACILYYENAAGQLYQHSAGYAVLHFRTGTRQLEDFINLLTQMGHLLWEQDWHSLLSDQYHMLPATPVEAAWMRDVWAAGKLQRPVDVQVAVLDSRLGATAALRWHPVG